MARPKGSKNRKTTERETPDADSAEGQGPGAGHNNGPEPLTDEEQRALAYHHKRAYQIALRVKKEADASFKNVCKLAKGEEVSIILIKHLIDLDSEEGQAKIEAEIAERYQAARWAGLPIDAQEDLFSTDRMPLVDKAFARGETAALNGDDFPSDYQPGSELYDASLSGWNKGNATRLSMLKKKEAPAPILDRDEAFPSEGEGSEGGEIPQDEFDAAAPTPAPPTAEFDPDPEMPSFLKRQTESAREPEEVA